MYRGWALLLLATITPLALAQDDVYRKAREKVKKEVEMEYLQTKEALRILKREIKLRRKKEKLLDTVEGKKKDLIKDALKLSPSLKVNIQGVAGEYAIVDGFVLPSGVKTPYGHIRVVGSTVLLDNSLVFPSVVPSYQEMLDYMRTLDSVPYYINVPTFYGSGGSSATFAPPPP